MSHRHSIAALALTLTSSAGWAEQTVRDTDRLRILRSELVAEQGRAEAAIKRHAERLAARDPIGADEAEQARVRSLSNLSALQRELEQAASSSSARPEVRADTSSRSSGVRATDLAIRWWDVYARSNLASPPIPGVRAPPRAVEPSPSPSP